MGGGCGCWAMGLANRRWVWMMKGVRLMGGWSVVLSVA